MNTGVHLFVWTHVYSPLGYIPRSEIAGSYGTSGFYLFRKCQTVFQNRCTILPSHQQCMSVLISYLLTNTCYIICLFDSLSHLVSFWNIHSRVDSRS